MFTPRRCGFERVRYPSLSLLSVYFKAQMTKRTAEGQEVDHKIYKRDQEKKKVQKMKHLCIFH